MARPARRDAREAAHWWMRPGGWEIRWQLEAESMRRDETIACLRAHEVTRMPDVAALVQRYGVEPCDAMAYSANADTLDGRVRLVAVFFGHPDITDPEVLCLDGPRESDHRNPPFEDGVFGKSAHLCLYYRKDPDERRWRREHGLLGLFDLARIHLANEHEWRRTGIWPGEYAPHGETTPATRNPGLAIEPISPRNRVLDYTPTLRRTTAPDERAA
jgi:hypothetical protein